MKNKRRQKQLKIPQEYESESSCCSIIDSDVKTQEVFNDLVNSDNSLESSEPSRIVAHNSSDNLNPISSSVLNDNNLDNTIEANAESEHHYNTVINDVDNNQRKRLPLILRKSQRNKQPTKRFVDELLYKDEDDLGKISLFIKKNNSKFYDENSASVPESLEFITSLPLRNECVDENISDEHLLKKHKITIPGLFRMLLI